MELKRRAELQINELRLYDLLLKYFKCFRGKSKMFPFETFVWKGFLKTKFLQVEGLCMEI